MKLNFPTSLLFIFLFINQYLQAQTAPKRELRAAWIATVANIDWPSKPGLEPKAQQEEFVELLDMLEKLNMNAVIVQVRPSTDAFYYSRFEPWSEWLSGEQGKSPQPYYDPLQFMIAEAHERGMEFHAWFNPYRAIFDTSKSSIEEFHLTKTRPDLFLTYGKKVYFDPGIPVVRDYLVNVIKDVTLRYDIDAVHFDDYFYPYKIAGQDFPDSTSFRFYGTGFTPETKEDWRRKNVDEVIEALSKGIKEVKPDVKFGISPFGVWRNIDRDAEGSNTKAGMTNYDDLYADILKWLKLGWIDYVAPQLYWPQGHPAADYTTLLQWWDKHAYGRHVYVGHAIYRIGQSRPEKWLDPAELPEQIQMSRQKTSIMGNAFYSSKHFKKNSLGFCDSLKTSIYPTKALPPTMPWIDKTTPAPPSRINCKKGENGEAVLQWSQAEDSSGKPIYHIVYRAEGKDENIVPENKNISSFRRVERNEFRDTDVKKNKKYTYIITAIDRTGNESGKSQVLCIKNKKRKIKSKILD
ncbi:family 10 glycosylhydrolase [Flammeovirgaceae bacterium SG7u.111]|nr:family 10 glycosylhydrolase [Flammeovirgaceae bacterium SG7u.132]WPO37067.1 family 10 glycosylhydrolase [Flammeovirgaceae bacterium SG7u.111]